MLKPISDIDRYTHRFDLEATSSVLQNGVTGTFVKINSDQIVLPAAGDLAYPVWTESNRDGTSGWSPDSNATGKLTILFGQLRAKTDQFTGAPGVGEKLYVDTAGKLTTTSGGGQQIPVAVCTKASHSDTYLSKSYDVIEFVTIV